MPLLSVYLEQRYTQQCYTAATLSFVDVDDASLSTLAPNLNDAASLDLSVVVPAYNEAVRGPRRACQRRL